MSSTNPAPVQYPVTTGRYVPGYISTDDLLVSTVTVGGAPITGFSVPTAAQIGQVGVFNNANSGSYQSVLNAGPWVFDVRVFGAKGDGQYATDASITNGQNTVTCPSGPFKSTDVGKAFMFKNALVSNATTLVTTITGYVSPTQVTLAANATATVASAGRIAWATDDTAAIQSCINTAFAYGQKTGIGVIWFPPSAGLFYGIAGPLVAGGATAANGQLVIPINPRNVSSKAINNKVVLWFLGATDGGTTRHWEQLVPQSGGSTLVSFGVFANATAQTNSLNANGSPAVISGQTGVNGWGTSSLQYNNVLVRLQNMQIYTTHSANGWTYGALNLHGVAAAALENFGYGTTGTYADGDFNNPNGFSAGLSIGVLMPSAGNNDNNVMRNVICHGGYTRGLFMTEHTDWLGGVMLYCWSGICPVGNYGDGGSGVGASHGMNLSQISIEGCNNMLEIIGPGQAGVGPMISGAVDTEGSQNIRDNSSGLVAACGVLHFKGNGANAPTIASGTPMQVICDFQFPGPASSPPALTINTAVMNPYGRWVTLTLVGGTGITTVQLSALMGGASAPAMTTVYTQSAGVLPLYTVRVGPQGWVQINGSTTPTATWWLE